MSKAVSGRSSIHRRKDGAGWEGWVSFGIDPRTGKRRRRHVRGRTKAEVDDKIKALETARGQGTVITGSDTTLSDYLDTWVSARSVVVRPTRSPDTARACCVRRLRLHDCRHSAATALLVLGTDARVLMATMGWTSMSLVQRYTYMVPELRHDVAARQAALWPELDRERRTLPQT